MTLYIFWDLDDTLYRGSKQIMDIFARAAYGALRSVVSKDLREEEVSQLLQASRRLYGDSFTGLAQAGHDIYSLHKAHHDNLDHTVIPHNPALVEAFEKTRGMDVRHVILTHGEFGWTDRVLRQVGIRQFFRDEDIISTEKINFAKKHKGYDAYIQAMKITGSWPENSIMIDDKAENLRAPHELNWLKTIRLSYDPVSEQSPAHVHSVANTPEAALEIAVQTPSRVPVIIYGGDPSQPAP